MAYRKRVIFLVLVIVVVVSLQLFLPGHPAAVAFYSSYIFRPWQSARNTLFGNIPVSIGDLLYVFLIGYSVFIICRWIYYLIRFRERKHELGRSLIHSLIFLGVLYVFFFIGWGGNYFRPALREHWKLQSSVVENDSNLIAFDSFLIQQLNVYAPHYRPLNFQEIDRRTQLYYKRYTDGKTRMHGLNAKASIFGYGMEYLMIQGYYNPFTGEAQVNKYQPSYMLPFVVAHELAHQSGIASEEDANLLSFALSTTAPDTAFRYSAYFNIWLYTHARVFRADSNAARSLKAQLNPLSIAHLDTLRAIRKRYRSGVSEYSGKLYDSYLKLHNQKDGIGSYNNVAWSAMEWIRSRSGADSVIRVP